MEMVEGKAAGGALCAQGKGASGSGGGGATHLAALCH